MLSDARAVVLRRERALALPGLGGRAFVLQLKILSREQKAADGGENEKKPGGSVGQGRRDPGGFGASLGASVLHAASPTSYQLAVENEELQKRKGAYTAALRKILDDAPDAVGCARGERGRQV